MIDITTAYILKTWGVFMSVLFVAGELLVLLIDLVFKMFDDKRKSKKKCN